MAEAAMDLGAEASSGGHAQQQEQPPARRGKSACAPKDAKGDARGLRWAPPSLQRAAWRTSRQRQGDVCSGAEDSCASAAAAASEGDKAGGITSDDALVFGVQAACLAYTDDLPGTADRYDTPLLRGTLRALEAIAGGAEAGARAPLSQLAKDRLGLTVDHVISQSIGEVDTQGFIAHNVTGDVVLAFRGTTNPLDWLTDLEALKMDFEPFVGETVDDRKGFRRLFGFCGARPSVEGCGGTQPQIHRGFFTALCVALPDLEAYLLPQLATAKSGISGPRKRLIVAGHSLGGAIATAAFAFLLNRFDFASSAYDLHLVTLGAPRVGDDRFAAEFDARCAALGSRCRVRRLVYEDDCVPTVPPEIFGFSHIAGLQRLRGAAALGGGCHAVAEAEASASPEWSLELIRDHEPVRYLCAVDARMELAAAAAIASV
eukprot:TRINITY_DN65181_c0_g1_i1.p1 TRINITY_DN65181_c0_g1~~TRINITY_DN65181_c0_g1_i1.p1  ORF type:complete len:431 (-),score=116.56 TRINITY_DN65181_c0_g1_i1:20-1312(-)